MAQPTDSRKIVLHPAKVEPKDVPDLELEAEVELVSVPAVILRIPADLTSMTLPALPVTQAALKAREVETGRAPRPAAAAAEVTSAKELAKDPALRPPVASVAVLRVKEPVTGCALVLPSLVVAAEANTGQLCFRAPSLHLVPCVEASFSHAEADLRASTPCGRGALAVASDPPPAAAADAAQPVSRGHATASFACQESPRAQAAAGLVGGLARDWAHCRAAAQHGLPEPLPEVAAGARGGSAKDKARCCAAAQRGFPGPQPEVDPGALGSLATDMAHCCATALHGFPAHPLAVEADAQSGLDKDWAHCCAAASHRGHPPEAETGAPSEVPCRRDCQAPASVTHGHQSGWKVTLSTGNDS
mmetsp:Transcript_102165/g.192213  ORF Transcript_102165/g.192213 Transcript_102165/m.192213 type:complete len:360 (+) Transcript_102165:188-1267(+)